MTTQTALNGIHIDGQWLSGPVELPVFNPCTEAQVATVAGADASHVELAVAAARRAFAPWAALPSAARAGYLRRIATAIGEHRGHLAELQSLNNGKPDLEVRLDLDDAIATFEYYAELADGLDAAQDQPVALPVDDFAARLRREPCGVVGLIVPWNFPMVTTAWKLAPALAAGCSVVFKPSEVTPLAELELARLIGEILPAGVFNLVCGTGPEVGAAMAGHPGIAKVSFTGSNAVGTEVMRRAASTIQGVSLELGGKSSLLVLADADLELAVDLACAGGFFNAGQMCSATSRVLVAAPLYEMFLSRLLERVATLRVGAPGEADIEMGPLVSQVQFQRVLAAIAKGRAEGARLECGGQRVGDKGWFVAPTVFTQVLQDSALWREEIFGPVLCVRSVANQDEAIALANDSDYGLVASVIGQDADNAARVADALQAGMVWINAPQVIFPQTAWGGYKRSSLGRELGPWGLQAFQQLKHVVRSC